MAAARDRLFRAINNFQFAHAAHIVRNNPDAVNSDVISKFVRYCEGEKHYLASSAVELFDCLYDANREAVTEYFHTSAYEANALVFSKLISGTDHDAPAAVIRRLFERFDVPVWERGLMLRIACFKGVMWAVYLLATDADFVFEHMTKYAANERIDQRALVWFLQCFGSDVFRHRSTAVQQWIGGVHPVQLQQQAMTAALSPILPVELVGVCEEFFILRRRQQQNG